jgi:hypothetical protein
MTLKNSVGLYGVAEIARQAFYDTSFPLVSLINIFQWLSEFSCLNGRNGQAETFVKQRLEKDVQVLQ